MTEMVERVEKMAQLGVDEAVRVEGERDNGPFVFSYAAVEAACRATATAALEASGLVEEVERLREALKPFAALRLSTEAEISDCLYRSPAMLAREQADAIEQRDKQINEARATLSHTAEGVK